VRGKHKDLHVRLGWTRVVHIPINLGVWPARDPRVYSRSGTNGLA